MTSDLSEPPDIITEQSANDRQPARLPDSRWIAAYINTPEPQLTVIDTGSGSMSSGSRLPPSERRAGCVGYP